MPCGQSGAHGAGASWWDPDHFVEEQFTCAEVQGFPNETLLYCTFVPRQGRYFVPESLSNSYSFPISVCSITSSAFPAFPLCEVEIAEPVTEPEG